MWKSKNKTNLLVPAAIATTIILWASSFVGIRYALKEYSPVHLAVLRYVTASVFLIFLFPYNKFKKPDLRSIVLVSISGLLGIALYNIMINIGEQDITAPSASFIVNTVPLFTALLSFILFNEKIVFRSIIALFICFSGVGMISYGEQGAFTWAGGFKYILTAAFLQAIYFIIQKIALQRLSSSEAAIYSIWAGTIVLLLFSAGILDAISQASWQATVSVIYLGVFPAALGYTIWSFVILKIGATQSAIYLFLVPIVSLLISMVWINEVPGMLSLIGGSIVLIGVILFNLNQQNASNRKINENGKSKYS
jgi:drug/metabolite transporter (DMT)-like permease